jgi:hypothetical protein
VGVLDPGQAYAWSAWFSGASPLTATVRFRDAAGGSTGADVTASIPAAADVWVPGSFGFTVPPGTTTVTIGFAGSSSWWMDDVVITDDPTAPLALPSVYASGFESGTDRWVANIGGSAPSAATDRARTGTASLRATGHGKRPKGLPRDLRAGAQLYVRRLVLGSGDRGVWRRLPQWHWFGGRVDDRVLRDPGRERLLAAALHVRRACGDY